MPLNDKKTIFLASGNPDKVKELRQMLEPLGCKLMSVLDHPGVDEVEEDQSTLEGNALKKARFWHHHTGLHALADDTGLEVDALDGEPGVFSARYAGESVTYEENVIKLLENMAGKSNRHARFRTAVAFVGGEEKLFEGICEGKIIESPRGEGGFGYDPVFVPDGYDKTFAELTSKEKNVISHRGKALEKAIEYLQVLFD